MKSNKEILIIGATHGNEKIGVQVINNLKRKGYGKFFDYLIANPNALTANKRFIDFDLNRAYPGDKDSPLYEKRIAYDNLKTAKRYKYIIDVHEASSGKDDFIIIPRKTIDGSFPLQFINLKRVLLWPDPKGPLSQVLNKSIELEFGVKGRSRKSVVKKAIGTIEKFISYYSSFKAKSVPNQEKEIFYVYGKLLAKDKKDLETKLTDFKLKKIDKEVFYPLLTGQYLKDGIICYKMRKLSSQ
jgi:succinylglutamate desuccinylase